MKDYDFRALNDKEFERLTIDLLSKREGVLIERFKSGKDGGIDGLFHSSGAVIIQSKHYVNTGYSGLISKLKNEELAKVKKLNPNRYILVTSLGLTPNNKNEIIKIFHPYISSTNDVLGCESVNDLIVSYPEIERNHYKLWLSSSNILIELLNNAAIQKRNDLIEGAIRESHKFIETQQLRKAVEVLDYNNVVIITGLPGVGKTTLAKQVTLYYLNLGYEIYHIEDSITDVESSLFKEKKQFFYFDDFLGANYLEIFSGDSDSKIVNFIKRVIADKNKKMILTSRTNILNKAKNLSESFCIEKLEKKEFEINVSDLTDIEKAEILYNHIWHSLLPEELSNVFYDNKNYWKIIKHKNFNPRLISFITDSDRVSGIDKPDYWGYIQESLSNPETIWSHCFNNQIPEEVLDLVCIVVFSSNNIDEDDCVNALKRVFATKYPSDYYVKVNKINEFIKESLKSTINKHILLSGSHKIVRFTPFNPSISDYIINRFSSNDVALTLYFKSLETPQSINTLFSLRESGKIKERTFLSIANALIKNHEPNQLNVYYIHLYYAVISSNLMEKTKKSIINAELFLNINEGVLPYNYKIGECFLWVAKMNPHLFSFELAKSFIFYSFRTSRGITMTHEDYLPLSKLVSLYPDINDEQITTVLMENIKEFWYQNFDEHLANTGKLQSLFYDDHYRADDIAFEMLRDLVSEYNLPFEDSDVDYMFENVDTSTHLDNSDAYIEDEQHSFSSKFDKGNTEEYIDNLFSRR